MGNRVTGVFCCQCVFVEYPEILYSIRNLQTNLIKLGKLGSGLKLRPSVMAKKTTKKEIW